MSSFRQLMMRAKGGGGGGTLNLDDYGNLSEVDENFIATGSYNRFITPQNIVIEENDTFELQVKVRIGTAECGFFELEEDAYKFSFVQRTKTSSAFSLTINNVRNALGGYSSMANMWKIFKFIKTSATTMTVERYNENEIFEDSYSISFSSLTISGKFIFGWGGLGQNGGNNFYLSNNSAIDFKGCLIKKNNTLIWQGVI